MQYEVILFTFFAGLVATVVMSLSLYGVHTLGLANADMIRSLGSLLTKRLDNALLPGLVIHLISGSIFAFPYAIALSFLVTYSLGASIFVGGLVGLAHGFAFSFILIVLMVESHPIERFREVGLSVAVVHVLAHVVYGIMMGVMVHLLQIDFGIAGIILDGTQ